MMKLNKEWHMKHPCPRTQHLSNVRSGILPIKGIARVDQLQGSW